MLSGSGVDISLVRQLPCDSGHAIIQVNTFKLLYARDENIVAAREHLNELFGRKYPNVFTSDDINYYEDSADELAIINYTSGTSGFSKGVMIPYRAVLSNIEFARTVLPGLDHTKSVVSMLPSAHMYGLMFELLYELSVGAHVHFLSRVPSPKIIMQALADVKPYIIIAVPLVIEKIEKSDFPNGELTITSPLTFPLPGPFTGIEY